MRKRAGALYIKDGRLLLISENRQGFYWTPGGGLEDNETFEQALERELKEELNASLVSAKLYVSIEDKSADEEVHYFLVDVSLPDDWPEDTLHHWYGRDNHQANSVPISQRIYKEVFPKLIGDGLV